MKKALVTVGPVTYKGAVKVVSTVVGLEGGAVADARSYQREDFLHDLKKVTRKLGERPRKA